MILNIRHMHWLDHGSLDMRKQVNKRFDVRLSSIGQHQAYRTGEWIGELFGRDKEFVFICSPYYRCLETAELILSGLVPKNTKLYQNKIFVEDSLRESQEEKNVFSFDNFDEISFVTEDKIVNQDTVYNTLKQLKKYQGKDKF